MKKVILFNSLFITALVVPSAVFAQAATTTTASGGVTQIQTFIQSVIQVLVTLAGLLAAGFFVWGGIGYITSSGHPEHLDRSKKTIVYSAIGLAITLGAFVLSNIVSQLATTAFGK